jgi:hypothetical protein
MPHTNTTIHIKKGEVVSVSSSKRTQHHTPLDPRITHVRTDINWEQVLAKYSTSKVKAKRSMKHNRGIILEKLIFITEILNDRRTTKLFLEKFAKDRKFDPLVASNWYQISTRQISKVIAKPQGIRF